jgi:hypothetical protein
MESHRKPGKRPAPSSDLLELDDDTVGDRRIVLIEFGGRQRWRGLVAARALR